MKLTKIECLFFSIFLYNHQTLRIAAPIGFSTSRRTTEDVELGPYHIPKGSFISLDIYGLHHNPAYWVDPDRFDPERFAEGDGNNAYAPFGNYARQCIGMNFSLAEQRVLLCMFRKYSFLYLRLFFFHAYIYPSLTLDLRFLLQLRFISSQVRMVPSHRFHP